ncbi:MAG: APC family permease, partial [Pseudorhodobacter sp.]|nr:APC family permease [Frankiaceae bacterium]
MPATGRWSGGRRTRPRRGCASVRGTFGSGVSVAAQWSGSDPSGSPWPTVRSAKPPSIQTARRRAGWLWRPHAEVRATRWEESAVTGNRGIVKRLFIGRALASNRLGDTLLSKKIALPVFCSDPISSVAYATEQILLVLGAAGAASYLGLAGPIAGAVALLLAVVVASYRQTCFAYPSGGGAYVVSKENIGRTASLIAAAALLVDYVMTVAVSVVSGVVAVTSAAPSLASHAVLMSVAFVALLAVVNLRGVKESGAAFALPTYAFVALTFLLLGSGVYRALTGGIPDAASAHEQLVHTAHVGGVFTLLLCLRAFASGCTALTGVEAISNGVPAFKKPKSANAAATLTIMGGLAISMFGGITALAIATHARAYPDGNPSVISQIA